MSAAITFPAPGVTRPQLTRMLALAAALAAKDGERAFALMGKFAGDDTCDSTEYAQLHDMVHHAINADGEFA